ncbi:MAG TPA: hypothetical protein VER58_15915 [Thermoanaerobaculia bacterium]|nr:hypothetical protein [Thermoanaerobaculia bacterium]
MRSFRFFLVALLCPSLHAATTIDVSTRVAVPGVKRFGINLGWETYYDSAQITKNLVFRNPGFEGQISQSLVHVASGTATGFVDDYNSNQSRWPTGFWNGASFEVIVGVAKGRAGTISSMTAAPNTTTGSSYQFTDSGTAPAAGDYILLRRSGLGGASYGWSTSTAGAGTISGETVDLAPDTPGHQSIRLSAPAQGDTARISANFDSGAAGPFIQLNGNFRLSFKARGAAVGSNSVALFLGRGPSANVVFLNQSQSLTGVWNTYNIDFLATDNGVQGTLTLSFTAVNGSIVLLDEVSLTQTSGDVTNTTAFRDPVVNALKSFNPAILRTWVEHLGDSLDNEIAPPFARQRESYSSSNIDADGTSHEDLMYGLHEFLELCDLLHAEPWWIVPTTFTTQEMSNLIEYLSGPSGSTYGAKRAARGRTAPWTDTLPIIHLEFGNEAWNNLNYRGATIGNSNPFDPESYAARGSEMFGVARSSPYFVGSKYDLVLGGQADFTNRNTRIHNASSNNDSMAVAPYFGGNITSFDTDENLFGPLFAEPEMINTTGYMRQNHDNMAASGRPLPLSIYEVNLHTTGGTISQPRLNDFTPSIGAGVAVADHMLMMLRDLGIRNQCLYSLSSYANGRPDGKYILLWGSVRDMGVTDRKRPQFLAVKLANEALGGDLVQTTQSGDNPTWNQPLVNTIQYMNAHFIQSYAFVNGNHRSVIVFNLHRTSNLDVNFSGLYAPSGPVTMRRLFANAITDNNESAENVVIQTMSLPAFDPSQAFTLPPFSMTVLTTGDNAPPIPTMVQATAQSTTQVAVSWTGSGATQYEIARMSAAAPLQVIGNSVSSPFPDNVAPSTAYLYRIRATGSGGTSSFSIPDVATTVTFSDDPIAAGVTMIRADHVNEMRTAANLVNTLAGLPQSMWTDSPIMPGVTLVRAGHILELRSSVFAAFTTLGVPTPAFANNIMVGNVIHAADLQELRDAVH